MFKVQLQCYDFRCIFQGSDDIRKAYRLWCTLLSGLESHDIDESLDGIFQLGILQQFVHNLNSDPPYLLIST